jgi:hypothetical protein
MGFFAANNAEQQTGKSNRMAISAKANKRAGYGS